VVDLDAALAGRAANLDLIERIARLPVRVQAAGGLSVADVERALEHGADRAVLGAGALAARSECEALFARRGGRVAVALDVRGDRLMPRGARDPAEPLEPVLDWLAASVGPPGVVVYTDVMRDGAMAGPDRSALSAVADRTGLPVIASGGIRSASDIRDLVALAPAVIGAIVGRALHEGALTLAEALASVTPASATDGKAPRRR
jgi:phosphoribosylformimino-5-aminoimidazole carboxamide ribonucleotide (ProFAR) isomerase